MFQMSEMIGDELKPLKSPFPYYGGKSRAASLVWGRFGHVANYVEPFFGSGAVLFAAPYIPKVTTVNDADGLLANFFRALQYAPHEVARYADNPVNENDLTARHIWLVGKRESITAKLAGDPFFYDARAAGWWCWGISCWIGSGWCSGKGSWQAVDGELQQLAHLGNAGQGVHRKRPDLDKAHGKGVICRTGLADYFAELSERLRSCACVAAIGRGCAELL